MKSGLIWIVSHNLNNCNSAKILQSKQTNIHMVSADRIDTPPLEASAEKMHLSMDDRDVLETSESKGPLYLQAAPGSTVSIHR
jgi:hypothetical protein